jgi:hypothetical protein
LSGHFCSGTDEAGSTIYLAECIVLRCGTASMYRKTSRAALCERAVRERIVYAWFKTYSGAQIRALHAKILRKHFCVQRGRSHCNFAPP